MTGREHILIGAGTTAILLGMVQSAGSSGLDLVAMWPPVALAAAGSLAPDLDHPRSLASMGIPGMLIVNSGSFLILRAYEARHPGALFSVTANLGESWAAAAWLALAAGIALALASLILCRMFGHRGVVHSLGFGVAACLIVLVGLATTPAPLWLVGPFAWGWSAHLLADATTPAGLEQPLWPLVRESA